MGEEMILVSRKEYEQLKWRDGWLDLLEARGVDNWQGYCYPPDRDEYNTEEEYEAAYQRALYGD